MSEGYLSLTEKEKATLRLLVRGYDAKTSARHLKLSVHTVNERLRNARQKMSVSSSREAARMLFDEEGIDPDFFGDKLLGEGRSDSAAVSQYGPNDGYGIRNPLAIVIGGILFMTLILAILASAPFSPPAVQIPDIKNAAPENISASAAVVESDVARSARKWLALIDDRNWDESWRETGKIFQQLNTNEKWASVAGEVQPKLGAVLSRDMKSQEFVPAPPYGYEMIKFQTQFENRPDAVEVLTLVREDSVWRVVGYWIE